MTINVQGVITLLEVFDMRRSVAFYTDILGFEIDQKWEPDGHLYWAMLRLGGAKIMLNSRYEDHARPLEPDPRRVLGHEDIELYFDCADVDRAYEYLSQKKCGVSLPETTRYGSKQIWLTDPDGFKICLQQPIEK